MSPLECVPILDDPSGGGLHAYSRACDWRDLTIMALADDEAELRARVVDLEAERESYRELAQEAIQTLARLTTKHRRLTQAYYRLREENRSLRERAR